MLNIPYGRQQITEEDIEAVADVLRSDFLTQGPVVEKFENQFSGYIGSKFSVAVSNGTAALHLAALALDVKPGDRVLVTPNTFVASANCIRYCGGDVEFVDIDPKTYCMDLGVLRDKIQSRPPGYYKGIVCVAFAGYPLNTEEIRRLADAHNLWIIEDACHAVGAEFLDSTGCWQKSGSSVFADISVFSFHPVKHVATGEGGMITTSDDSLAKKLRQLRTHGITREPSQLRENHGGWYYEMQCLGFNYRISDILCALGLSQLKRIESNLERRREVAAKYIQELSNVDGLTLPFSRAECRHAYHLFVVQAERRNELYEYLRGRGIFCQVHYIPVHLQPYYVDIYGKPSLPKVEKYYSQALSLPMFHGLKDEEQGYVIESVIEFFESTFKISKP